MMKKNIYIVLIAIATLTLGLNSCQKSDLEDLYPNPAKSSTATVENFFTGILRGANEVVMPWYWRFFVVEQPTLGHYTQVMGWYNNKDQYIPPPAAMDWRWDQFYNNVMTNYRVMERLYDNLEASEQEEMKIFMYAATIFFCDQSQQIVDLFGDIPWTEAGRVRELGDLTAALPKYDDAATIYATMIDDLKAIGDDMASMNVPSFVAGLFKSKDYLNDGDLMLWRKYANSLRLRMLIRISDVDAGAAAQIADILNNPDMYPVIDSNAENIMLDAGGPDLYATTSSMSGGIRSAMETWGEYDIAPYAMVKNMVDNGDPRLEISFDPNINGEYIGMNPMDDATTQSQKATDRLISRYDTSTYIRNNYFPGFVISAAEVSFMKAEALEKGMASGNAKEAYETGVAQSIEFYFGINATGDYREPLTYTAADVATYLAAGGVNWNGGMNKMTLIATQKWLNSSLGGMPQTWAEYRRLDAPAFEFQPDNASAQSVPPVRWLYPESEKELNGDNYSAVSAKDDLNTKIFWDVN